MIAFICVVIGIPAVIFLGILAANTASAISNRWL